MVLCSGKGHGLNTQKKRKVRMMKIGLLYSKGSKYQSFKPTHQDMQLQSCDPVQDPDTKTLLPPYHLHTCSVPLTLFICFPFLPWSSLSPFLPHVLPMALHNAQHHPLLLVYYLNCLICTFQIKKKKTLFFQATNPSWTTLMMKAEISSEMSVTTILTKQQSSIFHKT